MIRTCLLYAAFCNTSMKCKRSSCTALLALMTSVNFPCGRIRIQEIYPDAKKVLDYYHCSKYLHDLANAQYGKSSQKARGVGLNQH